MDPISPPPPNGTFFSPSRAQLRRIVFFGSVFCVTLASSIWLGDLFWRTGLHKAHFLLLGTFVLLNTALVLGSFYALFGAWDLLIPRRSAVRITKLADSRPGPLSSRYAIIMPVYNEDSSRFCARIEAVHESIRKAGHIGSFDFFILSDTRDLDLWVLEETAWANLCRRLGAFGRIYYRRRKQNENRKAGNIGDFVRTWGGSYEGMVVLDADSLMDGADIVTMARTMEAYPRLGILQTPPKLIRGTSFFARLQQFAMRLYGPLFIRGLSWCQLGAGSYWGHNALIRVRPFSDFCELPDLPGSEPFGGKILSHDFVEAALMVRAGWEVWLAWDIEGTYEEAPPTLIDHLKRDRRWCQGNLQHLWLVFANKLPLTVRMHLLMGIMGYLSSPLWFLFLIMGTWIAWDWRASELSQLPSPKSFIGSIAGVDAHQQSLAIIIFVLALLFLPKILATSGMLFKPALRKGFGGTRSLLLGSGLETILSMLLAPSIMVSHTLMVLSILLGRAVGWGNQNRETDGTPWGEAFKFHLAPTLLGVFWTYIAVWIGNTFALWMSPILAGLLLTVPVSVWTSRTRYGKWLANYKILSTPEELYSPEVLRLADKAVAALDPALDASQKARFGILAAVVDPYVNGVHVSLLEASELSEEVQKMAERCLIQGPKGIEKNQLIELLYHSEAMLFMHRAVWLRQSESIHSVWTQAVESYRRRLDTLETA